MRSSDWSSDVCSSDLLLNWMPRMVAVRAQLKACGRGEIHCLYPANRKILAYVRAWGEERILCVANLARTAQAVELDLSDFRGVVPVELTGRTAFPPIGDLPYLLTLPGYAFYWFLLEEEAAAPDWHRSEEHTSELQSLMRNSYAVFCLKKK